MTSLILSRQCANCKWLQDSKGYRWKCRAFPKGIPMPVLKEEHDHREPYKGDHGVRYETSEKVARGS